MNGIIVINKPKNYTSFDVIAVLRKKLNQKKIGHMGTLDPMATGVLPILLGETAKFQIFTKDNDKKYIASMKFGITTDTLDITGKVLSKKTSNITQNDIENILHEFTGEINQIPPMFSAIKKNGIKLCNLARKGIEIEREKRKITIKNLNLLEFNQEDQILKLEILCSKGTYIRTLCADIGEKLKVGAVMAELCRTQSNGFDISQSVNLEEIKNNAPEIVKEKYVLPTEILFKDIPNINITTAQAEKIKHGANISLKRLHILTKSDIIKVCKLFSENKFVGLGEISYETEDLRGLKCLHS